MQQGNKVSIKYVVAYARVPPVRFFFFAESAGFRTQDPAMPPHDKSHPFKMGNVYIVDEVCAHDPKNVAAELVRRPAGPAEKQISGEKVLVAN